MPKWILDIELGNGDKCAVCGKEFREVEHLTRRKNADGSFSAEWYCDQHLKSD